MSDPRIAVIAIHGVGDHLPFDMAKSVANMLEDLEDIENGERVPRYCAFGASTVRLNVAPVKVQSHAFETPLDDGKTGVSEKQSWGPMGALYDSNRSVQHPSQAAPDSLDHLFMEGQLAKYKGDGSEDTYEVLRLSGKRRKNAAVGPEHETVGSSHPSVPETEVHVYDMFWSDLSGVSKTGLRIFGELYQLTFHLASIGVGGTKMTMDKRVGRAQKVRCGHGVRLVLRIGLVDREF